MTGRVQDKIAIVTGGCSGIGRATARRLAEEGAKVTITDIKQDAGQAVIDEVGHGAIFMAHDCRDEQGWQDVVGSVVERFGGLDVLVNCAGILGTGPTPDPMETTLEEWRAIQSVNMEGTFLGCKAAVRAMAAKGGGGSIVNLSSVAGLIGTPLWAYGASKGGVRLLTKSVALYCGRKGYKVRCNSIHPGLIDTPMGDQVLNWLYDDPAKGLADRERLVPLGEVGKPEDVANAALYLASDESRYVTGAELVVDGGYTIY